MNLMPAVVGDGLIRLDGHAIDTSAPAGAVPKGARLEVGVRPEFVSFAAAGLPVRVGKVADAGRYRIVETQHDDLTIRLLVGEGEVVPSEQAFLRFDPAHTHLYADGWRVGGEPA
jgi:glycerol transport system ATP-binding protein